MGRGRDGRIGVRVGSFGAVKGRKEELANVKWGRKEGRKRRPRGNKEGSRERDHRGSHGAFEKSVVVLEVIPLS